MIGLDISPHEQKIAGGKKIDFNVNENRWIHDAEKAGKMYVNGLH